MKIFSYEGGIIIALNKKHAKELLHEALMETGNYSEGEAKEYAEVQETSLDNMMAQVYMNNERW